MQKYNVILFEPKEIQQELKIAEDIFEQLEERVNAKYQPIADEWKKLGWLKFNDNVSEIFDNVRMNHPHTKTFLDKIPEKYAFNSKPYHELGLPKTHTDFNKFYQSIADQGIDVCFFNTIGNGATPEYVNLAGLFGCGIYPACDEAKWIATCYLKQPIPPVFKEQIKRVQYLIDPASQKNKSSGTMMVPKLDERETQCIERHVNQQVPSILPFAPEIREQTVNLITNMIIGKLQQLYTTE